MFRMTIPVRAAAAALAGLLLFQPALADGTDDAVARGRYLVTVGGCNDCHTPGWMATDGQTPESDWMKGDTFGWNGPWGTTYGPNLRLYMAGLGETEWVTAAHALRTRPPMPWYNLNRMSDEDLVAIYRFVRQLGPVGEPAPQALPPGIMPSGPHMALGGMPAPSE